jgi:hypothetical protein
MDKVQRIDRSNEDYRNKGKEKIIFIDSTQKTKATLVSNKQLVRY